MIDLLSRYDKGMFLEIVNGLIPDFKKDELVAEDHSGSFNQVQRLGTSEGLSLDVFVIKIKGSANRRIGITTDSFKLLKRYSSRRALIAYWSESEYQWRISLLSASHKIIDGKLTTDFSNPRRHSYLIGPETKVATPTINLIKKGMCDSFEVLEERFALEVVNKEFYTQIALLYTKLVGGERKAGASLKIFKPLIELPETSSSADRHEFGVRLLGRIIFCWFLKQKKGSWEISLLPDSVMPIDVSDNKNILHEIIEPLFFEVLNVPRSSRRNKFRTDVFDLVPYLNGGLFEPLSGSYGDHYENGSPVSIPDSWFVELFDVLNTYSFTIDENTSFDVELSVDPEMLGRIFENLLAEINPDTGESARKATGSFYTPRLVVEYMVDHTLSLYIQNSTSISNEQVEALVSYDKTDDHLYPLSEEQRIKVVKAISKFTALDPACGSGAFPMGLLQKLVYILQEVDPDCSKWMDEQCASLPREIRKKVRSALQVKGIDYVRKLGVIRQCIYGVDIQPVATEISRLRCFLTLIVDEVVDDMKENRGIEPLPNLEFKFVTANSLFPLDNLFEDSDQGELFGNAEHIDELANIRDSFFGAVNNEKSSIRSDFTRVQANMCREITRTKSEVSSKYEKLARWKPFSLEATDWFDPKWMFGLSEFSVVIANPPYGAKLTQHEKNMFRDIYQISQTKNGIKGSTDSYAAFIELGLKLVKRGGNLHYILPISVMTSDAMSQGHKLLESQCELLRFSAFAVRPKPIFENATVNVAILLAVKTETLNKKIMVTKLNRRNESTSISEILANLKYQDVSKLKMTGRYPKISDDIELIILGKLQLIEPKLGGLKVDKGKKIFYRAAGGRYYKVITDYSTNSSAEKFLVVDEKHSGFIGALLSTSLFFWYYQLISDNLNLKKYEIESFPIPIGVANSETLRRAGELFAAYQVDIEKNANIRKTENYANISEFKEYKLGRSIHLIDEMDDYLDGLYGLSAKEIKFVKSYERKFRLEDEEAV